MVVRIMEAKVLGEDPQQAVERTERFVTLARMGELHDRFLDANLGGAVGREMMLGLGLGVVHQQKSPSEHDSDGFKTAQQEAGGGGERVETMEWRMLGGNNGNGGGIIMEEEALATEQGKEIAAMMVGSAAIDFRDDREGETVKTEEGEGGGVVVVDSWRIESFDSVQAAEENRRVGSDCEHWRSEIGPAALRLQEWSHKAGDTNSNSNPIANVNANTNANGNVAEQEMKPKSLQGEESRGGHVLYWKCQRNLAVGKGTAAVYDGCGEFLPAVGDGTAADALKCAACNCHRSFHRRIVLGRDESAWEERERQLREGDETLFVIRQAATDIKASAGRALPLLSQDIHRQKRLPIKDIRASEYVSVLKSCVEAMGQNASALLAVSDCLSLLHHLGGAHPDIDGKQEVLLKRLPTANAIVLPNNASVSKQSEPGMVFPSAFYHPSSLCWQNGMMFSALPNQSTEMGFVDHRQKRKRTRFSFEQLQKLNDFATRMGWTLAGVPKEDIDTLCLDVGIEAVTLKYWIHNTRQKSKRKFSEDGNRTPPRTP